MTTIWQGALCLKMAERTGMEFASGKGYTGTTSYILQIPLCSDSSFAGQIATLLACVVTDIWACG